MKDEAADTCALIRDLFEDLDLVDELASRKEQEEEVSKIVNRVEKLTKWVGHDTMRRCCNLVTQREYGL